MINGHGDDAYHYPEGITTDFSSNICPHADHSLLMAHLAAIGTQLIGHYPEPEAWTLEQMLADRHGISPQNVIVTSGATEAIYLVAQAFRLRPVIPVPTFSEYRDASKLFPCTDRKHSICWLCNPNNPTGQVYDHNLIEHLTEKHDLVVIDQSYESYTKQFLFAPRWACRLPNVIQIHSMTKTYAVPGVRIGYITAPLCLTRILRRYLRPWSVGGFAVEAGKFLLQHNELIQRPDFNETMRLWHALNTIDGITVMPTHTNFMLGKIRSEKQVTSSELKDYLARQHRLLIRDASNFRGLSPYHFRVATQSPGENDALVSAISLFLTHHSAKTAK